ncbi:MAG: hypothetical protein WBH00_03855, partial [Xanthobacteraceae bacterium]
SFLVAPVENTPVVIFREWLRFRTSALHYPAPRRWSLTMRDSETRRSVPVRELVSRVETRIHVVALGGAFALIAAVLFGTLTYRPF